MKLSFSSLGAFEFSVTPAYTRGQKVQEAGLTAVSPT